MASQPYYLRAQFSLAGDPSFLRVTHGDIFQINGRDRNDGTLHAVNIFTGEAGHLPRPSQNVYVEVSRKDVGYVQPVVLIGSLASHVHDLLLSRRSDAYATPVPHTTRPRRPQEKHGAEYWFVQPRTMENMLKGNLFVECGRLGEFLYGTSEAAIRTVAQREKKHCILDLSFSMPHLLARGLYPIVIFVGAQTWRQLQDVISFTGGNEYQAREMLAKDTETLQKMAMYFSGVVRERSLEDSFNHVVAIVDRCAAETWIPMTGDPNSRLI